MPRLALALLTAAVLAAAAPAHGAGFSSCSGSFQPNGMAGDFYGRIQAKGVGCAEARQVTRAWVKHVFTSQNAFVTVKVLGYACRTTAKGETMDSGGSTTTTCTMGAKVVRFRGQS